MDDKSNGGGGGGDGEFSDFFSAAAAATASSSLASEYKGSESIKATNVGQWVKVFSESFFPVVYYFFPQLLQRGQGHDGEHVYDLYIIVNNVLYQNNAIIRITMNPAHPSECASGLRLVKVRRKKEMRPQSYVLYCCIIGT